jgi:hypothetical protein
VSIEQIPLEVLSHTLNYIKENKYRKIIRLVNTVWFEVINYSRFQICRSTFGGDEGAYLLRVFRRYEKHISLSFPILRTKLQFGHLTNLVALSIPYLDLDEYGFTRLTNLTALTIHGVNDENSMAILTHLTNLRILRVSALFSNNFHLPNLVSLEYQHIYRYLDAVDIPWPSLTHLNAPWSSLISTKHAFNIKCLTVLSEYERSDTTRKCYTGLEALVSRNIMFDELPTSFTRLEFSYKTTPDQSAQISRLTNLKELVLDSQCANINISTMTILESFRLIDPDELMATKTHAFQFLEQIRPENFTRLEYILENKEQMNMISRLTALRHLTLRTLENDVMDCFNFDTLTRLTRVEYLI